MIDGATELKDLDKTKTESLISKIQCKGANFFALFSKKYNPSKSEADEVSLFDGLFVVLPLSRKD